MNLFSRSNQKGAPSDTARPVSNQPRKCIRICKYQSPQKLPSQKCNPGQTDFGSLAVSHPIGKPNASIAHWLFFSLQLGESSLPSHSFAEHESGGGVAVCVAAVAGDCVPAGVGVADGGTGFKALGLGEVVGTEGVAGV